MRNLVPVELVALIAIALVPWPDPLPLAIPLVAAASIAMWVRGASWGDVCRADGTQAVVGVAVGIAALVLGLVAGTPLVEALGARTVEWSANAAVRGNTAVAGGVVVYAAMVALCMELALRGWVVDRVLGLAPGQTVLAVLVGAFAEAIVTPGDATVRIGAGVFGIGLGWMFVAAKRNVLAPMLARVSFAVVLVILETMRVIG